MNIVYGPVPSRRLGMSLGIDPIPKLTCTFDCVYCQLGKKRHKVRGKEEVKEPFPTPQEITAGVEAALAEHSHVDYITFSGSGEPTLNPHLAKAVEEVRKVSRLPVALITNSSLLTRSEVLAAAALFDLVLPSLDAGDQETFLRVNRPATGFEIDKIASAIGRLARRVPIWLEVMLVKSEKLRTNTDPDSIGHLIEKIRLIDPHEVNLNTCVRPPEEPVDPVPEETLLKIRERMEVELPKIPIVIVPKRTHSRSRLLREEELSGEILQLLAVRPCTPTDLSDALGINPAEVGKYLARLAEEGKIGRRVQASQLYYTFKGE
ncbi:radical SAM protein [Candidatus Bipolaricaulota bacterium]|nr:radical SAM protein [Candidatus Bipolaricaulota bacterium]